MADRPSVPDHPLVCCVSVPDAPVAAAWNPGDPGLVILGAEGRAWHLDPANGALRNEWSAHADGAFQAAWQPGGTRLATGGQDGRVVLWDPATGTPVWEYRTTAPWVEHLLWSPCGRHLAIGAGREVVVVDAAGQPLPALPPGRSTVAALAWAPTGRQLAVAAYGGVALHGIGTDAPPAMLDWKSSLISLAWSPDGRWIVAGTQDQAVQVWELPFRPGTELAMSGYPGKVRELAWHSGGRILATAGGEAVMAWNCGGRGPAGTSPRVLEGHAARVTRLAYQHRGHALASGDQEGNVLLWNAGKSGDPVRRIALGQPVTVLQWAPDDSRLAIGCHDGTIALAPGIAV